MNYRIERCRGVEEPGWLELRRALWPHASADEHRAEMARFLDERQRHAQFVARAGAEAVGLAEASLRSDYVNGTSSSPVAFLEGLYVLPAARRRGVARRLVAEVAAWSRAAGCTELASDALLANEAGHALHRALGFEETERVVFFRRALAERTS